MKIIFLDIDGVLMGRKEYANLNKKNKLFNTTSVKWLNKLIEQTDSKIVVSSSWRNGRSVNNLKVLFSKEGVKGEIISKTPYLFSNQVFANYGRGEEIKNWLLNYRKVYTIDNYVIIDDDVFDIVKTVDNEGDSFLNYTVYVKDGIINGGFKKCHFNKALKVLNRDFKKAGKK